MLEYSVARLPISEQPAEIQRRLVAEWADRQARNLPMSPANMCDVLGIDKVTLNRWKVAGVKQKQNGKSVEVAAIDAADAAEVQYYEGRGEVLRAWLVKCECSWLDVAGSAAAKSAVTGANNILNKVFGYERKAEEDAKRNQYEDVLARVRTRKTRDKRKRKAKP